MTGDRPPRIMAYVNRSALAAIILLSVLAPLPLSGLRLGAYVPDYRLAMGPGAENRLGRASRDPDPAAWDHRLAEDRLRHGLPSHWSEGSWNRRLAYAYDEFYLHVPIASILDGTAPDPRHAAFLHSLVQFPPPDVRISVIGTSEDFLPAVEGSEDRADLVGRLIGICRRYDLGGVDLDWEFPGAISSEESRIAADLVHELDASLGSEGRLTAAVSRWRLPDPRFFDVLDGVHLMAYDGFGRHSTYESAVADTEILVSRREVAADSVVLGLPFYGRVWNGLDGPGGRTALNYRDIVAAYDPPPESDEAGGYAFNGPLTVHRKARWARRRGLGGLFVWEPFYDARGTASLIGILKDPENAR